MRRIIFYSIWAFKWETFWWCIAQRTAGVYEKGSKKEVRHTEENILFCRGDVFLGSLYRRGHCSSVTWKKWPLGYSIKSPEKIGLEEHITILRCIWQGGFLSHQLPLHLWRKIRILMTNWQWFYPQSSMIYNSLSRLYLYPCPYWGKGQQGEFAWIHKF